MKKDESINNKLDNIPIKENNKNDQPELNNRIRSSIINLYDSDGKIFVKRKSLLSVYGDIPYFCAIFNILFAIFIYTTLYVIINCIENNDSLHVKNTFIKWISFEKSSLFIAYFKIITYSFLIYPITYFIYNKTGYYFWFLFLLYFCYICYFSIYTFQVILQYPHSLLSIAILCIESIRMTLKMHSFFRENIRLSVKKRHFPTFIHFLYFFFCPTAIYKDSYPRNKRIKILRVIKYLFLCFTFIIFMYIILESYFIPRITLLTKYPFSSKLIIIEILSNVIPATVLMLIGYLFYFHSFLNLWSEVLCFADRLFYSDWWNATNYSDYYKTWNIVVQDWLRTYVFNECRKMFPDKYKNAISSIIVIIMSAIVHEYVMFMLIGTVCPGFIISFGCFGLVLKFLYPKQETNFSKYLNCLFWLSWMLGNSILVTSYMLESQLYHNCKPRHDYYFDIFKPRILTPECYGGGV